ncbi:MAG: glycosyltransferase family 2 protein, partial [Candidatus Micrarchaeota archaeon]|nr:glycosyltransferase family 2 protein [Candidatus Micrarchaeota archaeon]
MLVHRNKAGKTFKVSIVIPTKNRPEDLMQCLESLRKQSYPIDEIVIVDGSDDNRTEKVCNHFMEKSGLKLIYIKQ